MQQETDISGKPQTNWPERIKISIWLVYENDQWSALASEFDVVGVGATEEAALENLDETLGAYLASYIAEGAPYKAALRPIPWRERARLKFYELLTSAKHRLPDGPGDRVEGGPRSVHHSKQDLTPSGLAHC
jgi:predicted RNase H-like HicB family nuclease